MKGPGAFVIHLLAYLFGTRLQFSSWWFDSRVPVKRGNHNISLQNHEVVEDFISHSFATWAQWDEKDQKHMTNLLFMHCRAPAYEWDWESFTIEYMVFDGCYRLAVNLKKIEEVNGHGNMIKEMCKVFGIPIGLEGIKMHVDDHFKEIVDLLSTESPDPLKIQEEVDGILRKIKKQYGHFSDRKLNYSVRREIAGGAWTSYCKSIMEILRQDSLTKNDPKIQTEVDNFKKTISEIYKNNKEQEWEYQTLKKIVDIRNELLHESLWDNRQPGTYRSQSTFMLPLHLRKINQRILPALLDYKNAYVSSNWGDMSGCSFSRMDEK